MPLAEGTDGRSSSPVQPHPEPRRRRHRPPQPRPRVYCASTLPHANTWSAFTQTHSDKATFTSSWYNNITPNSETPENARIFWPENIQKLRDSQAILAIVEEKDVLRGALIEIGAGLVLGLPIYIVGNRSNFSLSTWQWHPSVRFFSNLEEALSAILRDFP